VARCVVASVLLALICAVPVVAQTGVRKQILPNGGFEEGLTGWQPHPQHQLIEDAKAAHRGNNSLFGEVTKEFDARVALREVELSPDKLYEFEIWARATNATKLVLWRRTAGERSMVQAWQRVPTKWTRYGAPFSVEAAGITVLEVVAPSSHGAPMGKMWVDDIALYEYDLPPADEVSGGIGFNDQPSMVCTNDGQAWFAWVSVREGEETLQVSRGKIEGNRVTVTGTWQVDGGPDVYLLDPNLGTDGESVWLTYAAEKARQWDIFACRVGPDGPGDLVRVTRDAAVDIHPVCAVIEGEARIAWESNRDDAWRQIYLSSISNGRASQPQQLSTLGTNNYAPTISVSRPGGMWVVWHSFRDNNFDLYGYSGAGEQRLTSGATVDREPRLFAGPNGPWLAWDNANSNQYHIGAARAKRVQVARLSPTGLQSPQGLTKTRLWRSAEMADVAVDPQGRLWVCARVPRSRAGWDVVALCYSGDKWSQVLRIASRKGLCRRPALGFSQGRVVICYQGDNIPMSWPTMESTTKTTSAVFAAALDPASVPPPASLVLDPYEDPGDAFEAAAIRLARAEDLPGRSITYQGKRLNLYFGDLHEHTDISVCNRSGDQTQRQSYQSMRDVTRHDFAALTDHGYNFNQYLWAYTAKMARVSNDPGRFLTFLGEEWTSSFEKYDEEHPYGYYGHRNLILEDSYYPNWFNSRDGKTPAEVWEILRRDKTSFIHIPHQLADTGNVPTDWNYADEDAQPVAEIFQTRGSYEYEGTPRQARNSTPAGWYIQDAWARGIVIGVIASPDHGGGYGKAAVYAPELSRRAILDAIRARHTYGTTAAKMFLDVRVNGHLMGEKGASPDGKPVRIEMSADCPDEIDRIEVCRNNTFIYAPQIEGKTCDITYLDNDPPDGPSYYYVRVIQKDGEIAWSSPVWLGRAGPA